MTTEQLLIKLELHSIKLVANGKNLRLRAKKGAVTAELRAEITEHKKEILRLLSSEDSMLIKPDPIREVHHRQFSEPNELREIEVIEFGGAKIKLFQAYAPCQIEGKCFRFRLRCQLFPLIKEDGKLSGQCQERFTWEYK